MSELFPNIFNILLCLSLIVLIIFLLTVYLTNQKKNLNSSDILKALQEESRAQRHEMGREMRTSRSELNHAIAHLTQLLTENIHKIGISQQEQAEGIQKKIQEGLRLMLQEAQKNSKEQRTDLQDTIKELQASFEKNIAKFNLLQKEQREILISQQKELLIRTESQLEKMRHTVDEKLHKTLEERLGHSFQIVSHRLEAVQKGLGAMQKLAHDVGDLKSVLSNVKTRGTLGEIQLGNILAEILSPQQYESNVKIRSNSQERVEFAIKLPGREKLQNSIYLPIDAKFPQASFVKLERAYAEGNASTVEATTKELLQAIKKSAKDISKKYVAPPYTTDFGIMFLSTESLFAEVLRHPDLITTVQRDYKIIITGPTTLAALLNSLQMGFKTLAIQRRSSEVWQVLAGVKNEFDKFGSVLEKAQYKIQEAHTQLDKLVGERTRVMLSKLKKIEDLPSTASAKDSLLS